MNNNRRDMSAFLLWLDARPEGATLKQCAAAMGAPYRRASELLRRMRPFVAYVGAKKAVRWHTPSNAATARAWYADYQRGLKSYKPPKVLKPQKPKSAKPEYAALKRNGAVPASVFSWRP